MISFFKKYLQLTIGFEAFVLFAFSLEAAQHSRLDPERIKVWAEIKDLNTGDYLSIPDVHLKLIPMRADEIAKDLQTEKGYLELQKLFEMQADRNFEKAYVETDRFLTKYKRSSLAEWAQIFKADLLFQVQEEKKTKKYNLPLEEYQDVLRQYPLNPQSARILYQIGLLQLKMQFFLDVNSTASRGLKEFENSEYAPLFRFLDAEQAFLSKDDLKATFDYSVIIQRYPKNQIAVDAAFRKAFILFRRGDFKGALKNYEDLEKFHSEEIDLLKMKTEPASTDKFIDRIYYAETIFLNLKFVEAAKLFQDLANLFPNHPATPHLLLRLADTYLWRGQVRAAEELYAYVLEKNPKNPAAVSAAKNRMADLNFLTANIDSADKNSDLYQSAYEVAKKAELPTLAALSLAKLASHHFFFKTYPKAQTVLKFYRENFNETANDVWVDETFTKTVELEILDYYHREDYLAALTTYLMFERDQANHFQNTHALLKIADAANRLSLRDKASQILNRVIYLEKTSEGRQEALLRLVEILIADGEIRKASERLRRFSFAYPTTSLTHLYEFYWGQLYTALKNHEQASIHYEKAINAAKSNMTKIFEVRYAYIRLADESEKLKLPVKAIEAYEKFSKLIKETRDNPLSLNHLTKKDEFLLKFSRYRIADTYFLMHDFVKALDAYRIVTAELHEEPFLSHAFYRIGECYLALNDRKAALTAFAAIESKDPKNVWAAAAKSYIASVQMEVKYGIRIFN